MQRPETRSGIKQSLDSLLRTMFAPCAGADVNDNGGGGIGGVPRDEIGNDAAVHRNYSPPVESRRPLHPPSMNGITSTANNSNNNWATSVPFEVSTRSRSSSSKSSHRSNTSAAVIPPTVDDTAPLSSTPEERKRQALSRTKLRQLGARHQLASGVHGETLADTARPVSPEKLKDDSPDLVDFDDGISAISSHTLEEMERRRVHASTKQNETCVRVSTLDFRHVVDEDSEWKQINDADAFGTPFFEKEVQLLDVTSKPFPMTRGQSSNTRATNMTEDSREFEQVWMADEAQYWNDTVAKESGVGSSSSKPITLKGDSKQSGRARAVGRISIEERARRLRELSRSRSRSDGTGSVSC